MNPVNDVICNLLETPFSRWGNEDKRDVIMEGRPTGTLPISAKKENKKSGTSYKINFKASWFETYKWLCSSHVIQKLFCWPCLLFSNKCSTWNKDGFQDLLNITRALHKHEDSSEHLKNALMLKNFESNQNTIADALHENARLYKVQFNETVRLNRLVLQTVINAVLYLGKQELAFRGHNESRDSINRGNFKELLELLISTSPLDVRNHYDKIKKVFSGDSKTIQNEIIGCVADYIIMHINNEINNTNFFSIEVDDTTDITQSSQCSLIVRFVDAKGVIVERFLGFNDVSADRSSESLYQMLDKILDQFDYQHKLIGQCYDGASVMSGQLNGLQKKIKDKAPYAVFVHCLAHRLNLVLQQSFKRIYKCRIFFASISGIPSFFHHSAKRTYALTLASARRIPTITDTRWSSNSKLMNVIVQDWAKLKEVFENIVSSEESDQKSIQLAKGFLNEFNDFEFTFLALVFNDIFGATDVLFDILQKRSLDIHFCISNIKRTCELLRGKRNTEFFTTMFNRAKELTKINTDKRHYAGHTEEEICCNYRLLFYEILDHILMEMEVRFQDCERLQFLCLADITKFGNYALNFPFDALLNLQQYYGKIFAKNRRLKNELELLYADENYRNLSLPELLKKISENKDIFMEVFKLYCLICTIPSTSVSVERSFSCLKRLKTYSRNSISQGRLSSLALISIEKEFLEELCSKHPFHDDIIDRFAALKDRRVDLMYKN